MTVDIEEYQKMFFICEKRFVVPNIFLQARHPRTWAVIFSAPVLQSF